jgi:type IV pilus assembly protein PilO
VTLTKLPWYGQIGAFFALSVAGVAAFFYLYASPMQGEMALRRKKLEALQADIRKSQAIAQRLPQFRSEVGELETRLETLKNVLPEEKDMGDLLRRLHTLAVQSNLTIRNFKPAPQPITKQLHAEIPINLEIDGAYHNVGLFFDRVSKFPRIIHIGSIDIKGKDKQEPNSTITADFVATTFVLLDPSKVPPPAATTAKGRPAAKPAAAGAAKGGAR